MYERYYGLQERPFDLSPNPRFLFLSKGHREALAHLSYGLVGRPGVTVLVGEAGTGKTTLVRAAVQTSSSTGAGSNIVHLSNPTLTRAEFFESLAGGFGFGDEAVTSKPRFLRALERAVAARAKESGVLALIVDEAQSLPYELLEEIRLLTNLEVAGQSLAVVLVGQPELADRLNDTTLRQLKQRIALRCELAPLDLRETAAYIAARVRIAGGKAELLFTREAVIAIHQCSKGIPRTISVICDNSLVSGFAADVKPVGRDMVLDVCREFQLVSAPVAPPPEPRPAVALPSEPVPSAQGDAGSVQNEARIGGLPRSRRFSFFEANQR
jgi:general secretion pathway protein A